MIEQLPLWILALVWAGGTILRVYRTARFYQIDEYKLWRHTRWWFGKRERYLPQRPLVAALVGTVLTVIFSEGGVILPTILGVIATVFAVYPPTEREIKKAFVPTSRAKRLLGAAFFIVMLVTLLIVFTLNAIDLSDRLTIPLMMVTGFVLFLLAPLWLMAGNVLMIPVESFLRRLFIASARRVMGQVQPKVIGMTGSYGKTTTKNFAAQILNGRYRAYATPKSYNTMMGVCIAINNDLADNYAIDYFLVEMGAYFEGEIARICDLTPPDIGIEIEVGPQHLERFGSLENTAKAKYELIKALPPDGLGVFNWDNPYVREMYEKGYPNNRIAVSKTLDPANLPADVRENPPRFIASHITETLDGLSFAVTDTTTGENVHFTTPVIGEHNVMNILLATAVAVYEGMSLDEIAFQVRQLRPAESRLVRQSTLEGITIINDAYSANPSGVVSALKVLGMHTTGKRLLITPGMIELADLHEPENKKLGQVAAEYATDVILVGEEQTRPVKAGLESVGFPADHLRVVDTLSEAIAWYRSNLQPGDTVLFLNDLPDTY